MEKLVGIIANVFNEQPDVLKEKINTEDGLRELEEKVKSLKVFNSNDEFLKHLNNYGDTVREAIRKEQDEKINQAVKDNRAALERKVLEKHGINWKYGVDYKTTDEMLDRLIELKTKDNSNKKDDKEVEEIINKLKQKESEIEKIKADFDLEKNKLKENFILESELNKISSLIDVEDSKLQYQLRTIKEVFNEKGYKIDLNENKIIDKEGKTVRNDKHEPLTLLQVLTNIAYEVSPIKKGEPSGRGKGASNSTGTAVDFSAFENFSDYMNHLRNQGKDMVAGSKEFQEAYSKFKTAKGLN